MAAPLSARLMWARAIRHAGLPLPAFAERAGLHWRTLYLKNPTLETLEKGARAAGVDVEQMISWMRRGGRPRRRRTR